uniref:Vacuolar protein sorting-associated protein 28 homolog n=1 Tax=Panagrolaimus sp. ES5 TaxID=591445 RepID=A0AC34GCH0_9BILA
MNDYRDSRFLQEVRLYDSGAEREKLDNMSELYAVIMSLENLEKVFARDYISPREYTAECSKLLTQYKVTMKLLPGLDLESFIQKYNVNCPAAKARIKEDRPTTVREDQGNALIAEIVSLFITLLDMVKLNIRAVDEIYPTLHDLNDSVNGLSTLPSDFDAKIKIKFWHDKLKGMTASEEISDDVARQMVFEIETAYNSFVRFLKNT